jgi:hypothetical protein
LSSLLQRIRASTLQIIIDNKIDVRWLHECRHHVNRELTEIRFAAAPEPLFVSLELAASFFSVDAVFAAFKR